MCICIVFDRINALAFISFEELLHRRLFEIRWLFVFINVTSNSLAADSFDFFSAYTFCHLLITVIAFATSLFDGFWSLPAKTGQGQSIAWYIEWSHASACSVVDTYMYHLALPIKKHMILPTCTRLLLAAYDCLLKLTWLWWPDQRTLLYQWTTHDVQTNGLWCTEVLAFLSSSTI